MKLAVKIIIFLICGSSLLLACQNDHASHRKDPLSLSYQHIDRGEYETAISELTELSRTDSRTEVITTLASAYAARGGIKVAQYWGFFIGFKAPFQQSAPNPANAAATELRNLAKQSSGKIKPADLEALSGVVKVAAFWEMYQDRIQAIPVVEGAAHDDITTATKILLKVKTPGSRLYRAILDLILFKSAVTVSPAPLAELGQVVEKTLQGDRQSLCKFDIQKFAKWSSPVSYHLSETLSDLAIAFPDKQESLQPAQAEVANLKSTLLKSEAQLKFSFANNRGCQ